MKFKTEYIDIHTFTKIVDRKKEISETKQLQTNKCKREVCVPVFFNIMGDGRMLRG